MYAIRSYYVLDENLSRLPGGRGQMLRVLTGTRRGWLGKVILPPAFLDRLAMDARSPRNNFV